MEEIKEDLSLVATRDLFVELNKRNDGFIYAYVENYDYLKNSEENKIRFNLSWFCPSSHARGELEYLETLIKKYLSERSDFMIGPGN